MLPTVAAAVSDEYSAGKWDKTTNERCRLIAALDFGAKGENIDATTARSSCECSGYYVPEIDTKRGWQLHFESSTEFSIQGKARG